MAGGSTFPRYVTVSGTSLFPSNATKGTARMIKVTIAATAMIATECNFFS